MDIWQYTIRRWISGCLHQQKPKLTPGSGQVLFGVVGANSKIHNQRKEQHVRYPGTVKACIVEERIKVREALASNHKVSIRRCRPFFVHTYIVSYKTKQQNTIDQAMDIWLFARTTTINNTRSCVVWCCLGKQPDTSGVRSKLIIAGNKTTEHNTHE
jgi:hypothetical protein